jgi:hypothetical protein
MRSIRNTPPLPAPSAFCVVGVRKEAYAITMKSPVRHGF